MDNIYKPGDPVADEGPYWVRHSAHRFDHCVRITFKIFPKCNQCGDAVRFERTHAMHKVQPDLRLDHDFAGPEDVGGK